MLSGPQRQAAVKWGAVGARSSRERQHVRYASLNPIEPGKGTCGFIGMGIMGVPM